MSTLLDDSRAGAARAGRLQPALLPVLLCAAVVLLFYGGLLVPGAALAARDIPFLHLPLRTALRTLVASGGVPTWDPWQHGGQPLLSNPHYAAFYPPTWLLLWLPPIAAIHATVVLHAALAFAGAWRLARCWGLGRTARALAAAGFAGNGAFASLPGTLLMFCGFAWLPWAWSLARPAFDASPAKPRALPPIGWLAGVLALQILNGDPAAVLVTWAGLAAFALAPGSAGDALGTRLRRLAVAVGVALLLAGVQVVPTWARLRDSARASGLAAESTVWSTRPLRLLEALNPRLFGDPARDEEDLYFGAPLNDKGFPFLQSIYPGLLLASLGLGGLVTAGMRRRAPADAVEGMSQPVEERSVDEPGGSTPRAVPWRALALLAALGVLLGLGRFDPIYPALRLVLPFLDALRYPEKFLLLTLSAVVFAAAAGYDLLERSEAGRSTTLLRAALGVGAVVIALDAAALGVALCAGTTVERWIAHAVLAPLPPAALAHAVAAVRGDMAIALGWAVGAVLVLLALRDPRRRRPAGFAAIALVLADLASYGRRALPTVPTADLTAPRPLARRILESPRAAERVFSDALFAQHETTGGFRLGTPGTRQILTLLDALTPTSAASVGLPYALHRDFDLMLTGWGRQAVAQAQALGAGSEKLPPLLAAWNVGTVVTARTPEDQLREFRRTRERPLPATATKVPGTLPRWRFAGSATRVADPAGAFAAAAAGRFDLARQEVLIGASGEDALPPALDGAAAVLAVADRGGAIDVRYRARGAALFVAAQTFDDGWTARVGGAILPTWPTAIGQIAVLVPPSEAGLLELRYRDPWLRVGAALSGVGLLGSLLALSRRRRAGA